MIASKKTAYRDIIGRLGFDFFDQLDAMRGKGVRNIDIEDAAQASAAALRTWEDSNYPYRLPEDLRSFLSSSDGFSLSWMAKSQRREGAGGAGEASAASRDILVGRIGVNRLSSITRVPLDADDLRSIKSAPSNAAAAARVANGSLGSSPHKKHAGVNADGSESRRRGSALALGDDDGRDMYGVAAFALDSACETGRVALVYGAPLSSAAHPQRRKTQSSSPPARGHPTSAMAAGGFANPEVWIQDLSCRWHFLADDFTSYFRMMVVHLGILGWQQAFSPVGLSPTTEKCMRLYCPARLLFDQREWQKERVNRKAVMEASDEDSRVVSEEGRVSAAVPERSTAGSCGQDEPFCSPRNGREIGPRNR